jgi:DNA-binding NarL/FixJ family response regulator
MPAKKSKSRILLVDDHPIVRQGLTELINQQVDLMVCGAAEDELSARSMVASTQPDLIILDISLRTSNGIEVLKTIKLNWPEQRFLVLSMHEETLYAPRTLRAGASGYLMKHEATDRVLQAIRAVLAGDIYLSEAMGKRMMQQFVGPKMKSSGSPLDVLSDRELEVFALIGQGRGTRQIAEELHLSVKTVESHRAHIKEKLNLKSATELVRHAIQWRDI